MTFFALHASLASSYSPIFRISADLAIFDHFRFCRAKLARTATARLSAGLSAVAAECLVAWARHVASCSATALLIVTTRIATVCHQCQHI